MGPRAPIAPSRTASAATISHATDRSASSVRRNLFSSSLSRRPDTASSDDTISLGLHTPPPPPFSIDAGAGAGAAVAPSFPQHKHTALLAAPEDRYLGMLERDEQGNYGFEMRWPKVPEEEKELVRAIEEESSKHASNGGGGGAGIDVRLIDVFRSSGRNCVEPQEFRALVQAKLRDKVASLEEDRWMFEAEDDEVDSHN